MEQSKIKKFVHSLRQAILVSVVLMVVCGFLFPVVLSGLSSIIFPEQAKGSMIRVNGKNVGSVHVGQEFTKDYFMKGRPSAYHYNTYKEDKDGNKTYNDGEEFGGLSSGSNNYGPSNPELKKRMEKDIEKILKANPSIKKEDIPVDLVTASGSGLDPHISVDSAKLQIPAISKASGISEEDLEKIVEKNTKGKLLGIFGEDVVNVLQVNVDIAQTMGII